MKNTTTIFDIFQTFLTDEEVKDVSESLGYVDNARKLTLYDLIKFFIASATSVTSMSIMRLLDDSISKIEGGEIIFEGTDILKLSEKEMRSIRGNKLAMIFQEPMTSLNPVFTIGQQIGEAIKIHQKIKGKENKQKSIEMLKLVGIPTPELIEIKKGHKVRCWLYNGEEV